MILKTEKIQKVLARLGLGSRREIESWITQGRVKVNSRIAKLGERVGTQDKIRVDGRLIKLAEIKKKRTRVLLYHKPAGEVCTRSDPQGRATVFDHLPKLRQGRWVMIGRLDINTSGVLLFTNNGGLANRLMHPSQGLEREYAVRIFGQVNDAILRRLQKGIVLDDQLAKFESIRDAGGEGINHWYHVILREGRYREVRRLWESQGIKVSRLIRVRFANIQLPRFLRAGKWMDIPELELKQLFSSVSKN